MKRNILFILIALLPMFASAYDAEIDGIYYNFYKDYAEVTYKNTQYNSYSGAVVIPASITYNDKTYKVSIIGHEAFIGCSGLKSITIPEGVAIIFSRPFSGCSSLESIKVESGNPHYDSRNNCNAIIDTKTNTLIAGCKNTVIPNSVTSIDEYAFSGCSGLKSIKIPKSVTSIGADAFEGTTWYNSQPDGMVYAGRVAYKYKGEMLETPQITIKEGTLRIAGEAFKGCNGLKSIKIPNSVTSIGRNAFSGCSGLTSVNIPKSVTNIGDDAFEGCSGLTSITIPEGVTNIGRSAFSGCSGLTSVNIPKTVNNIGGWAFSGCSNLKSVTIPESVAYIGSRAFSGTAWYNNQPDGLVYVGRVAYRYKGEMPEGTRIFIKEGTLGIADWAFEDCTGLTSVTIPNSVTEIDRYAFSGCNGLTSIKVEAGNTKYYSRENCNAIIETATNTLIFGCQNTVIPEGVTIIGRSAFHDCSGLTSITIPESVTSIEDWAFNGCSSLTSITIPESVTSIVGEGWAFYGCSSLTSIKVEEGNTKYDSRNNCNAVIETATNTLIIGCKNTIIPEGVTSIGICAFSGCSGLTSITIPESVTNINRYAFYGCSGLTDVHCFAKEIPQTDSDTFKNTPIKKATLHVPAASVEKYKATSPWSNFGKIVAIEE